MWTHSITTNATTPTCLECIPSLMSCAASSCMLSLYSCRSPINSIGSAATAPAQMTHHIMQWSRNTANQSLGYSSTSKYQMGGPGSTTTIWKMIGYRTAHENMMYSGRWSRSLTPMRISILFHMSDDMPLCWRTNNVTRPRFHRSDLRYRPQHGTSSLIALLVWVESIRMRCNRVSRLKPKPINPINQPTTWRKLIIIASMDQPTIYTCDKMKCQQPLEYIETVCYLLWA